MAKIKTQAEAVQKRDPAEEPLVQRVLEAQARIKELKRAHAPVFDELEQLVEDYNSAVQEADKELRSRLVSCGPFDLYTTKRTYDGEKLYSELGEEDFLKAGGTMKKVTKFEVDAVVFEAMVEQGKIPKEVVVEVRTITPAYHKPPTFKIP